MSVELLHRQKVWVCEMRSLPGTSIDCISPPLPALWRYGYDGYDQIMDWWKESTGTRDRSLIFPEIKWWERRAADSRGGQMEAVISKYSFTDGEAMFGKCVPLYVSVFCFFLLSPSIHCWPPVTTATADSQFNSISVWLEGTDLITSHRRYTHTYAHSKYRCLCSKIPQRKISE